MTRSIAPWLLLAIVVTACTTGDSEPSGDAASTITTNSVEVSTTTLLAEVTTEDCEVADLNEASATLMEQGCSYTNPVFGVPMTITPPDDRWVSFGQGNRWMVLEQDADGDGASDAALTMLLVSSEQDPETVLEGIVQQDRVQTVAPASPATVLGPSATSMNVEVEPRPTFPCGNRIARFLNTGSYVALLNEGPNRTFGLPGCRTSRVWVLTVDDLTLTVIGAVRDENDFDLRMADLEDFLQNSVTFGATDG